MPNWPWRYFAREKLMCSCGCGQCEMDEEFMREFELHRHFVGVPFIVHSGYRCPTHDEWARTQAGQEGRGFHSGFHPFTGAETGGRAIDGHWQDLTKAFGLSMYFWHGGVGLYLKGDWADRFIHYDNGPWRPWTY